MLLLDHLDDLVEWLRVDDGLEHTAYAAYALSLRNLEGMMAERGMLVDHTPVHRWAVKVPPVLAKVFRRRQVLVGRSWRVDETYLKVAGQWKYP